MLSSAFYKLTLHGADQALVGDVDDGLIRPKHQVGAVGGGGETTDGARDVGTAMYMSIQYDQKVKLTHPTRRAVAC